MDTEADSRDAAPRQARQGSPSFDPVKRAAAREVAATEAAKKSKKDCRVYVGNLSFGVKWNDLKDFMRDGGSSLSFSASPQWWSYRRGEAANID